ncbi:response regulator transcription factor [Lentzea sp. NPDC051213]|uniref:response regulator transcription factor n=1 Tax=Lentzea sp. NPDC051213 TaxID=3364126 RepID=UPI0037A10966
MASTSGPQWSGLNVRALRAVAAEPSAQDEDGPPMLPGFEGLGPHAGAVLASIAVLGPDAQLSRIAHVADLSLDDTLAAVSLLTSAGLVANTMPLSFREERTAEQVLSELSVPLAIPMRLRAAEQLRGIPGAAERLAGQLIHIGAIGLDWAPEALSTAAMQAMDSGNWQRAADYLRHALNEHIPPPQRMKISRQLAMVLAEHDPRAAVTCLLHELRLRDAQVPVVQLTSVLRRLATWLPNTPDISRLFEEAADHLYRHSPCQALRLQVTRASFSVYRPEGPTLLKKLERWLVAAEPTDDTVDRALMATRACLAALHERGGGNAVELATSVLDIANGRQEWDACWMALSALLIAGADEIALEACRKLDATLPTSGAEIQRAGCDLLRGYLFRRQGDLRGAIAALERVLAGCKAFGLQLNHAIIATAAANLAEALVRTGEVERARDVLAEHDLLSDIGHTGISMCLLRGRSMVSAATGDIERALSDQLDCGRVVIAWAELNNEFMPWRLEAVYLLLRLGRDDDAVALAEAERVAAQAWGSPRAKAFAAHALALTTDGPHRAELLADSAALFRECGAKLSEAETRHCLSATLRDLGREEEAAKELAQARELARQCGATLLAELPVPRPAADSPALTPQESRIARLVTQGRTNAEIADELAVTRRTVEFHLSSVYRKLGINGRRELAQRIGEHTI